MNYCLFVFKPILFCFSTDRVTEVKTDIYVTSFGPVSDTDMVRLLPTLCHPRIEPNEALDRRQLVFMGSGLGCLRERCL